MVERYSARSPIEKSIEPSKQHHGFEQVQGRFPKTVERQAPLAFVQTVVNAWYCRCGHKERSAKPRGSERDDWMPEKACPSSLDMLATA